ncbi:MAG: hypothetical protein L3J31_01075 [Bacteroidales bacterium]|nr:hypothetical protein [Bacteroidales bacterium]MCF6341382.1 hypothetical protein [Bacteroidales bacterium]
MLFYNNDFMLTVPLYLKIILGNSFRVCPEAGGFVRTNGNYGLTTGLSLEYRIKKLFLFAKADYYMDVSKKQTPLHDGSLSSYNYTFSSVWVSLGVKWNILK